MFSDTWLGQAAALLVDAYLADRRVGEALEVFRATPAGPSDALVGFGRRHHYTADAELAVALGEFDRAEELVRRLEAAAEQSVPGGTSLRLGRLRGLIEIGRGSPSTALEPLRKALAVAEAQSQQSYRWRLLAEIARAHLAAGDREAARDAALRAMEVVDALFAGIGDAALRETFVARAIERLPAALRRRPARDHVDGLTAREAEIATLIARGLSNREIAEELVLSTRTVETHVANAMAKMGFSNRTQLAAWAVERGLTAHP